MQVVPKILALDIGTVRIGLALSDGLGMLAHPLKTIKWQGKENLLQTITKLISENNVSKLVVGLPYTMKGTESKQTKLVLDIKEFLDQNINLPVETIDERLTTKLAENMLRSVNKKSSRSRDIIDQISAVNILQTYLDKNRN